MGKRGGFQGQFGLGFSDFGTLQSAEFTDFVEGKKGKESQEFFYIRVFAVDPVLVVFIGRGFFRIEPDGPFFRFPHLSSGSGGQQRIGPAEGFVLTDPPDQIHS